MPGEVKRAHAGPARKSRPQVDKRAVNEQDGGVLSDDAPVAQNGQDRPDAHAASGLHRSGGGGTCC